MVEDRAVSLGIVIMKHIAKTYLYIYRAKFIISIGSGSTHDQNRKLQINNRVAKRRKRSMLLPNRNHISVLVLLLANTESFARDQQSLSE